MPEKDTSMPDYDVSREVLQRWVELEKMREAYSEFQNDAWQESMGIFQELVPTIANSTLKFNEKETNLLHYDIAGYLRTLYRINQVTHVLDGLCKAARWENDRQETTIPLKFGFYIEASYQSIVEIPKGRELIEGINRIFPTYISQTEAAVVKGYEEGVNRLLELFTGDILLLRYRRDLLPMLPKSVLADAPDGIRVFLPTRVRGIDLELFYPNGANMPELAFNVRPV